MIFLLIEWRPQGSLDLYLSCDTEEQAREYCRLRDDIYFRCKTNATEETIIYQGLESQLIKYDPELEKKLRFEEAQSALKRLYDNSSYDLSMYSADKDYETVKKFLEEVRR